MSEHDMRTLLRDLAEKPEPASTVDITAARRRGKRRLWARNGGISVAVAAALALAVVVPQTLFSTVRTSAGSGKTTVASGAPANAEPAGLKGHFNPLVPYAAFGYVPKGYTLQSGNMLQAADGGFTSNLDELTMSVAQPSSGASIALDVLHKGDPGQESINLNEIPSYKAANCKDASSGCDAKGGVSSNGKTTWNSATQAPDVDGRPAYWLQIQFKGAFLAWQYAPNAWATLETFGSGTSLTSVAADKALLLKMAPTVKFGQTKPILFPFHVAGAVPANYHPVSVTYTVTSSGQYLANALELNNSTNLNVTSAGVEPVTILASTTAKLRDPGVVEGTCSGSITGTAPTTVPTAGGHVSWKIGSSGLADIRACNVQPINGLYALVEVASAGKGAPPVTVDGILDHLTLNANPRTWTTNPLAS